MGKSRWESRWTDFTKVNVLGLTYPLGIISKIGYNFSKINILKVLKETKLNENSKIIDIGCGEGRTLSYFKNFGFKNIVGVDISESAVKVCEKKGFIKNKNVFVMNAKKLKFGDNSFDLVFAEGFLEHFKNFNPYVHEMARISKRYVMITQPNHFSMTGRLLNWLVPRIQKDHVKEYDYRLQDFIEAFNKIGFKIRKRYGCHLGNIGKDIDTSNILLFEKVIK